MYSLSLIPALIVSLLMNRRDLFSSVLTSSISVNTDRDINTSSVLTDEPWSATFPLEPSSGGTNSVRLTVFGRTTESLLGFRTYTPKKIYKAIVDTGSPYLVIAEGMEYTSFLEELDSIDRGPFLFLIAVLSGLFERKTSFVLGESNYYATEEIYGSQKGTIEWKQNFVQLRDEHLSRSTVFGVLDDALTNEAGGPLLGLVKRSNEQSEKIQSRPTFLGQQKIGEEIKSFQIDSPNGFLTMTSGESLIKSDAKSGTIMPLVDLRPLGDFVEHYACTVEELELDGRVFTPTQLRQSDQQDRKVIAVFDSGLTGCLFTQPLWEVLQQKGLKLVSIGSINVGVSTEKSKSGSKIEKKNSGSLFHFESGRNTNSYFNITPINLDWFDDEETCPYVIVLGQTFLTQGCLTIDIDDRRATFEIG